MALIGVWIHPHALDSREKVESVVETAVQVPIDKLIVLVKDLDGTLHFKYGDYSPSYDYLGGLIELCREHGLEVHAWFVTLCEGGEKPSGWLAEHSESAVVNERGEVTGWICPSSDKARKRILSLFETLLGEYEVDGIHLDYIRYPDPLVIKGCFCERCGRGGYQDEEWIMKGIENVDTLVEEAHELVKEYGVELSAAVYADYPECIVSVRQDWGRWIMDGLLDWVAPMNYTNIMRLFETRLLIHVSMIPEGILLLEGIGKKSSTSSLSPGKMLRQAELALRAGADGV
ncbi:MAG: hypothetical protein DRM97_08490, partial [Thermoprotei archaeon]